MYQIVKKWKVVDIFDNRSIEVNTHTLYMSVWFFLISSINDNDLILDKIVFPINWQDINITKYKKIIDCFVVNKIYSNLISNEISIKQLNKYPLILQSKGSNTRDFLDAFAKQYYS